MVDPGGLCCFALCFAHMVWVLPSYLKHSIILDSLERRKLVGSILRQKENNTQIFSPRFIIQERQPTAVFFLFYGLDFETKNRL